MNQESVNASFWRRGDRVDVYAERTLAPVEVILLCRYHERFSGRVVEVGCGAGRLLGYLVELGGEVHGIDLSVEMVEFCRRAYPSADVRVGDVRELSAVAGRDFDMILAAGNLIDVFDHPGRVEVIAALRDCLAPDGLLVFSSHNLAHLRAGGQDRHSGDSSPASHLVRVALSKSPLELASAPRRLTSMIRNRRRLRPLERSERGYAIVNDPTFDYALVHYYVDRDFQEQQLREAGLELVECLDPDGRQVPSGGTGAGPWLHYVSRRRTDAAAAAP